MNMDLFNSYTGKQIDIADIKPQDINIIDIARGLATKIRYSGQLRELITVARHSINLVEMLPEEYKREALLHDAAEVYLGDVPAPAKMLLPEYQRFEERVDKVIREKFGLPLRLSGAVKDMDIKIRETEMRGADFKEDDWGADMSRDYEDFISMYYRLWLPKKNKPQCLNAPT
jgi:hypothetical protein